MLRDDPTWLRFPVLVALTDFDLPPIDLGLGTFRSRQVRRDVQASVPFLREVVPVVVQFLALLLAQDGSEVAATETALPDDLPFEIARQRSAGRTRMCACVKSHILL